AAVCGAAAAAAATAAPGNRPPVPGPSFVSSPCLVGLGLFSLIAICISLQPCLPFSEIIISLQSDTASVTASPFKLPASSYGFASSTSSYGSSYGFHPAPTLCSP
uniref:Uncharacterized protein n=1 Tax=Anopheles christyi TaxID=43041 RepID=A0A182KJ02_9DIPT